MASFLSNHHGFVLQKCWMFLWHKPLAGCKCCSQKIVFLFRLAGERASFLHLPFLVAKRAARFRRVALKKLLSVFAEQLSCLPWHIYIIPHSFAKINTILSKFVHIRPHLSKFVQPAPESRKNKKIFAACPISFLPRSVRSERRVDHSRTIRQGRICRKMLTVIVRKEFLRK